MRYTESVNTTDYTETGLALLDRLTRELTAFDDFDALLNTAGTYQPTILPRDKWHVVLADSYDAFQAGRGDARRAWRGSTPDTIRGTKGGPVLLSVKLAGVPTESGGLSEWLRVIWAINSDWAAQGGESQYIGATLECHDWFAGGWVEEYPEFTVILLHTAWGQDSNGAYVQAKTPQAVDFLTRAVEAVTGRRLDVAATTTEVYT